jgi:hypothetical protein
MQHLYNPQKELAMKHKLLAVAVASLNSLPAFADGELGLTAKQLFFSTYPKQTLASGEQKSRM